MPTPTADRYQLVRRLGSSGHCHSYEAVHPRRPGNFLIDVLVGLRGQPQARAAFEREIGVLASLRHPFVQQTLEMTELGDGTPIAVSELPEGTTLQAWLDQAAGVPPEAALALITALADALSAAHAQDVSHGQVSADNVLLVRGTGGAIALPKLRGFGMRWVPGALPGLPGADARAADLTALAALAERLLAPAALNETADDRRFFLGSEAAAVFARARGEGAAFASPSAFAAALAAAVQRPALPAAAGESEVEPAPPRRRRARVALAVTGVSALAAAGLLVAGRIDPRLGGWIDHHLVASAAALPGDPAEPLAPPPVVAAPVVAAPVVEAPPPAPAGAKESPTPAGQPVAAPPAAGSAVTITEPGGPPPPPEPAPPARSAAPSRPPAAARRGLVWSARLGHLVRVDDEGLPLDDAFPAPPAPVASGERP
jgi:serine/threonine-protein kinase